MQIVCLCSILVGRVDWRYVESSGRIWISLGVSQVGGVLRDYDPSSLRRREGAGVALIAANEGIPSGTQGRAQGATVGPPHCHGCEGL